MKSPSDFHLLSRWLMLIAIALLIGCSSSKTIAPDAGHRDYTAARVLSPVEAAQLAAELANDECQKQFGKRPFRAEQHTAFLEKSRYRWGRFDEGAARRLSAVVTFRADGTERNVEVCLSTDLR